MTLLFGRMDSSTASSSSRLAGCGCSGLDRYLIAQVKAGSVSSVLTSGCFLATDLTEIQCDVSDVSQQYQGLGAALQERQQQLSAMLEKMQEVQEEASSMLKWLESKERMLSELDASSSPTKTETMRAQAEHNKVVSLPEQKLGIRAFPPKGSQRWALLRQD